MTSSQESKQKMGEALNNEFTRYTTVWSPNVIFTANVGTHINNLANVSNYQQKQLDAMDIKLITQNKKLIRTLLTQDTLTFVIALKALAFEVNDIEIDVNFNKGQLDIMSQSDYLAACNKVKNAATTHAAALVPHGITAAMQTHYAADILTYAAIMPRTRSSISNIKAFTAQLKKAVDDMMLHLKKTLDLNIDQYRGSDFYLAYKSARKVILHDNGTGLRGTIENLKTEMVLRGIQVEIVELNKKTFTNSKGHYSFKKLPDGIYTIRLRGEGYITTEMPDVRLEKGVLKVMDFTIEADTPVAVPVG